MSRPTILIAGGGTGGHVFPAIAVADALEGLAEVGIVFCGTVRGVEVRVVPARGWTLELLDIEPIRGHGAARGVRASILAARATVQALALVRRLQPRAVLSVGGYAAGPVAIAGALCGVPVAVLEPNRVFGLTNRLIVPFATRAYVAWKEAAPRFRSSAIRVYGVPLRRGFAPRPYVSRGTARVLVMGGSQGAGALNERMPGAIARAGRAVQRLEVVHQSGRERDEAVRAAYAREAVDRVVVVPFLDDVAGAIADADVIVARAGAGTIAEITAVGRAAVLVPFPDAADDHQRLNAEALARLGAAVSVRQEQADATRLASEIERLLSDDAARASLADRARACGKPSAAHDVAADLLFVAGIDERWRSANGAIAHARLPLDEEAR
jgi:UDP-N-acetylglucosamine--N-acetylmuramyl-(pentapeptide) pyrophosphoryl-undecaprenol N-acetylglucosamine transferase